MSEPPDNDDGSDEAPILLTRDCRSFRARGAEITLAEVQTLARAAWRMRDMPEIAYGLTMLLRRLVTDDGGWDPTLVIARKLSELLGIV